MTQDATILPPSWTAASLGEAADIIRGVTYKKADARYYPSMNLVPILRATNIERYLDFQNLVFVPSRNVSDEQFLRIGDIVVASSSGSLSVVGKAAQLTQEWFGAFGAFCLALRPVQSIESRYLGWFMQSEQYRSRASQLAAGVNINNLRRGDVEGIDFPLPPLAEQHRIVAEIEKQLTRLDASVGALRRAKANLKRYRASVLKAACEGRLVPTEASLARSEGREYEHAGQLLQRILEERRARWESQEKRRGAYKEPSPPDTSALPELPEGWAWATVEQTSTVVRNGYAKRPVGNEGTPILRISAVRPLNVDLNAIRWVSADAGLDTFHVAEGDLLFTRYNGNPQLVGVCGVVHGLNRDTLHPDKLIKVRMVECGVRPEFVQIVANTGASRDFLGSRVRTTAGQSGVSGLDVKGTPIPVPPIAEQCRIVAEVDKQLSVVQQAETTVDASLRRAERLRQSVLKRAFEGKLVPQDPDDEPASVLLERIRAEREAAEASASRNGARTRGRGRPSRRREGT